MKKKERKRKISEEVECEGLYLPEYNALTYWRNMSPPS
jgi:hypothetical protein